MSLHIFIIKLFLYLQLLFFCSSTLYFIHYPIQLSIISFSKLIYDSSCKKKYSWMQAMQLLNVFIYEIAYLSQIGKARNT